MRLPRLPKLPPSRRKLRALLAETGNELDKAQAEVAAAKERLGEARRDARKLAEDRTDQRKASERRDELMAERDDARLRGIRAERERDKARHERDAVAREARKGWAKAAELAGQRDEERARRAELERAIREFITSEDTHEPGPFVKDGNWHPGPCVEGGPRMEDVYPDGFQVCADEECFAYWPCDVERLRRALDGHDRDSYPHADPEGPCDSPWKVPVANVDSCQRCGHPVDGHDRQEPQRDYCDWCGRTHAGNCGPYIAAMKEGSDY